MTSIESRNTPTSGRGGAAGLLALPDDPGETVSRCLLVRDDTVLELGVSTGNPGPATVYLVTMEHCTHLSPREARAAAEHLLRAAADADADARHG